METKDSIEADGFVCQPLIIRIEWDLYDDGVG